MGILLSYVITALMAMDDFQEQGKVDKDYQIYHY